MKRIFNILTFLLASGLSASGQSAIVKDFKPVCDSLSILIREYNTVKGQLELQAVMKRGSTLDFYFTESLSDYPWHDGDPQWFRSQLKNLFPEKYKGFRLGEIYSKRISHGKLVTPDLSFDGNADDTRHRIQDPKRRKIVTPIGATKYSKGLEGRHIALWQSHGYYYDSNENRWKWQRPCLFMTVEDMFTQSFVLPYLVPMLENAGAYILMPRERDIQRNEVIADNDSTHTRYGKSEYKETGKWKDAGAGVAAKKSIYTGTESPFGSGTARKIECIQNGRKGKAMAIWRPDIPERGEYAVYISYNSLPQSSTKALYTVHHLGGKSEFAVNQSIGGGTWIYLGTFEFDKGTEGYVTLSNETPKDYRFVSGSVVCADAVRFGGGMGNIARSPESENDSTAIEPSVSGMPRSAEGARYWLQWAGVPDEVFSQNEEENDYKDDFMSRGDWVEWLSRGSDMNPKKSGPGIPVDLSFGFHSDAGITPNDSLIGTLAIYTLKSDGRQSLPSGESRMTSREYADMVQSQIVRDLRAEYDTLWNRRQIWDRGYRESRTPSCPAMLLELLSHQNFSDMKYGLDPSFRFAVSRSIYKGMLKYLSNRYGQPYVVQPLPVRNLGITFGKEGKAVISWNAVEDPMEETSSPEGYILYTRVDDGGFDTGSVIGNVRKAGKKLYAEVTIKPGHIYSFRIAAYNDGGRSFPSESVSIGIPKKSIYSDKILIINNFDRVSGPAFFDTPTYAGFDSGLDSGVPYIRDIAYIGDMHNFSRQSAYMSNDNPGFGASYSDYAGKTVAGNTFDYPYKHGKAFMKAGYAFYSCSNEAFCTDSTFRSAAWSIDLICGKQVTTVTGSGMQQKYTVFPIGMQRELKAFTDNGGNVFVSGSKIATDIWDGIYPVKFSNDFRESSRKFATEVLGYGWAAANGSRTGVAKFVTNDSIVAEGSVRINNTISQEIYRVESPDGISASAGSTVMMRYADSGIPAGICHEGEGYRTVCLGFPIEALKSEQDIEKIIAVTLEFFRK